ncbi:DUF6776 family protein [Coralloluteibacterium thermophilus]|uniref:DUF6776 family protein n=1 Tax=Coralloluteibacterium thermophilum TaxID=2707049 RepID=A0ABV9NGX7_9GAMM
MSDPRPAANAKFRVVPARSRRGALVGALALAWVVSLILAWSLGGATRAPGDAGTVAAAPADADEAGEDIQALRQRIATLRRSDEISRAANVQLQETLARRDEEIAALRADVAFYERLVGGTGPRQGLTVHNLDLRRDADGTWRYVVTLTQNLNRGAVTRGSLTVQVEGTRDGRMATLSWDDLLQETSASPQPFSFRYFQQLEGSLLLPEDFTPRRLIVRLRAEGAGNVERAFPWEAPNGADDAQGD